MSITISVKRSDEWVAAQRLETGANVPEYLGMTIEPVELSTKSRKVLLDYGWGEYVDVPDGLTFNENYSVARGRAWGREHIRVDSESPSTAQLDAAILAAAERVQDSKAKAKAQAAANAAENEARQAAKADREAKLAEARVLLAKELIQLDQAKADLKTLSNFLAIIPLDALRGALRKQAELQKEVTLAELQAAIEDAAPCYIFQNRADEDEADEDNDD